ncbi:MAG: hypothetical protein OEP95_12805 [Myxococcales bacterium]|nr:hypothetical protein [Myxococcales bacterium]
MRFSPLPLGRLLCLAALPWLVASAAATAATPEGLAPPGECAQARDLEIRSEPLGGTARRSGAADDAVSVSGAALRHFRAADVAAPPGVATAATSDWAGLGTPAGRSISGPGPCDSPASGCRGSLSLAPIVKATPRAPARVRARPAGRGKGGGGRKCD